MNNIKSKLVLVISIFFESILIITTISSLITNQWRTLFLAILAIISLSFPFIITYIANKNKIRLPLNFQLILILFIFSAQYFGEIRRFYYKLWWWDLLLHAVSGYYALIIAIYLIESVNQKNQSVTNHQFIFFKTIFAFSFSIALGTLWEMFEFVGDFLFKTNMIKGGLNDTATDLLVKIAAAFIASLMYIINTKK